MYDNSMLNGEISISDQLRQRRRELNLSLSEVARRAGTSPATLSRYENGWTRFETYTLRKLATALSCELTVTLSPKAAPSQTNMSGKDLTARLKRLFWDCELTEELILKHTLWVLERVMDFGALEDIRALRAYMGNECFLQSAAEVSRVSPRTRSFWKQVLEKEGVKCTKKFSRNTALIF